MAGIKQLGKKSIVRGVQDRWLLKAIDTHLNKKQNPPRPGVFFPSSVSNPCDRFVFMAYNGLLEVSTINGNLARIFDNGSSLEDRVDKYFSKMGILLGREISLKNDLPPISGRMDFLISHEKYGTVPIELKSINTRGFDNLKELNDKVWNDILTRLLKIMDMRTIPEKCTGDKWCKCKEV